MQVDQAPLKPDYPYRQMPGTADASGELGIQQLVDIIVRRWPILLATTLLITALAIGATYLMTPVYTSTAVIKIDPTQKAATDEDMRMTSPQADQSRIATDVEILKSRDTAAQVVKKLNLINDPEFRGDSESANRPGANAESIAVSNFLEQLDVKHESDSYIVEVSFHSEGRQKAAEIADAVVQTFMASAVGDRAGAATSQASGLKQRLDVLGGEIAQSESEIARYRAQAGIVEGSTQGTITDAQVGPISTQLAEAESEAASASADLQAARAQVARGQLAAVSSVLDSPVIGDLRRQRGEVTRELAQVEARYGPRHPEYERVNKQLQDIDSSLRDQAQRIVSALDSKARAAQARAGSLRSSLNQVRGQQANNTRAAVVADSLERQTKTKQAAYDDLSKALQQVTDKQRDLLPTATIVQRADLPQSPSSPKRALFGALGFMLGLLVGFAVTLLLEFLTSSIRSADDLERVTGVPFMASVPRLTARQLKSDGRKISPEDFVVDKPMSSYVEAFRTIRNSIVLSSAAPPKVIAVLSALPAEGKSTVSFSLARAMALSGDRVILVDCDLRRGRLRDIVGIKPAGGLVEVLTGKITVTDAIVRDGATSLDVLPLQSQSFTPVDLFSGAAMTKLIADLRARYDFVIFDTAPLLAVADSRLIASLADASIFVARSERTPRRAARIAVEAARQGRGMLLGSVLSMSSMSVRRMSSGDPAYYHRRYRQYQDA